jgi:YD repeat-containing protein
VVDVSDCLRRTFRLATAEIKDCNGNYLTANYNWLGDITTITDTLGRTITFNYDPNANRRRVTSHQIFCVNVRSRALSWMFFGLDMSAPVGAVVPWKR